MRNFRFFSCVFLFVSLWFVSCQSQAKVAGKKLVPTYKNKHWGLSTTDKKVVVPCEFDQVEFDTAYYAMLKKDDSEWWYLYTNEGKLVAKSEIILLNRNAAPLLIQRTGDTTTDLGTFFESHYGDSSTYEIWMDINEANAKIVNPDNTLTPLDGKIYAFTWVNSREETIPTLLFVRNGDKTGIYNVPERRYIIPVAFKTIKSLPFGVFLTTNAAGQNQVFNIDGVELKYDNSFVNAQRITIDEQKDKTTGQLVKPQSVALQSIWFADDNLVQRKTAELKRHERDKNRNVFDFVSESGEVLLKYVIEARQLTSDHYIIKRIDTQRLREMQLGVYSVSAKKFVFPFSDSDNYSRYQDYKGLLVVHEKGVKYYYSPAGKLLGQIADSLVMFQKEWNLFHVFELNNNYQLGLHRTFYAIRSDTNSIYKIYDRQYNLINSEYTGLREALNYYTVTFRKNGKWGLLDASFHEVVPPMYDEPVSHYHAYDYTRKYMLVKQGGKQFHIDMNNKPLFNKQPYPYINENEVNGKWLALDYDPVVGRNYEAPPKPKVKKLHIIDSAGTSLIAMDCDDDKNTMYELTSDLKILTHPRESYRGDFSMKLMNPTTGSSITTDVPARIIYYKGIPILLQGGDKKTGGDILYSVKDFKKLNLPSKHWFYRTVEITLSDTDNSRRGVLIVGVDKIDDNSRSMMDRFKGEGDETSTIIGFYSLDGVLYD